MKEIIISVYISYLVHYLLGTFYVLTYFTYQVSETSRGHFSGCCYSGVSVAIVG